MGIGTGRQRKRPDSAVTEEAAWMGEVVGHLDDRQASSDKSKAHHFWERRGKGSGQVDAKPCPHCSATVSIDPRRVDLTGDGATLKCPSCGGPVPVRQQDIHRAVPADAPPLGSTSRWRHRHSGV